jgi:hypothetical protein
MYVMQDLIFFAPFREGANEENHCHYIYDS